MARIRTIKPEFWTDEKVVRLSLAARLLFIGLWNFADDSGCLWYAPDRLGMQIFPRDADLDIASLLDELIGEGVVEMRENESGERYIVVIGFPTHQKIDHPTPTRIAGRKYKKVNISFANRRALAVKYWAQPGENKDVKCHYCGADGRISWPRKRNGEPGSWVHFSLEIDHIVPESSGGSNNVENLVLACQSCNRSKGTSKYEDFTKSREDSRGLAPEGKGREGKGMDGKTDNYRAERRGPEELAQEIEKAAKARDVKSMAGDFGDYRLPKNFGRFGGVYVANIPPDQCQFLLDTMSPGPMVAEALKWRIKAKATEGHTP